MTLNPEAEALYLRAVELEMQRREARGLSRWLIGREQKRVWAEYEAAKLDDLDDFGSLAEPGSFVTRDTSEL